MGMCLKLGQKPLEKLWLGDDPAASFWEDLFWGAMFCFFQGGEIFFNFFLEVRDCLHCYVRFFPGNCDQASQIKQQGPVDAFQKMEGEG